MQNFKNAARFDLKTVKIVVPNGEVYSVATAAIRVLERMEEFYRDFPEEIQDVLQFEKAKFLDPENRYAWKIRAQFSGGFVEKGSSWSDRDNRTYRQSGRIPQPCAYNKTNVRLSAGVLLCI